MFRNNKMGDVDLKLACKDAEKHLRAANARGSVTLR